MKSNTMITWLTLVTIGLGGIVLVSRSQQASTQVPVAQNEANPQTYDFGKISMAKGKVSHVYEFKNDSEAPITIEKVYTSCMCTTALLAYKEKLLGPFGMPGHAAMPKLNETLEPNSSASVEVFFDPAAHGPAGVGKVERLVFVETKAGEQFRFGFTAEVVP